MSTINIKDYNVKHLKALIGIFFLFVSCNSIAEEQTRDHWKDPINIIVATYNLGSVGFIYLDKTTFELPAWFFSRLNGRDEVDVSTPTKHFILPHDCIDFLLELDRINYYEEHVSSKFEINEIQYLGLVCASN